MSSARQLPMVVAKVADFQSQEMYRRWTSFPAEAQRPATASPKPFQDTCGKRALIELTFQVAIFMEDVTEASDRERGATAAG